MRKKIVLAIVFVIGLLTGVSAQDINANVTVIASRVPSNDLLGGEPCTIGGVVRRNCNYVGGQQ